MNRINRSFEQGLFLNLLDQKINDVLIQSIKANTKMFHSVDEFLSFYSCRSSDDVTIDNYRKIFLIFFFIQLIILFTFLINWIFKYIKIVFLIIKKYFQSIYHMIKLNFINWILNNKILKIRKLN